MQLIAGRTAQEYNWRKHRDGAFWEDRYHATAIQADDHLHQRVVYIDLNMVRAAVGSLAFVENVESELGSKAMQRDIEHIDGA